MTKAAEAAMRTVRIIKLSFLVYSALLIVVIVRMPAKTPHPANSSMEVAITLIALVDVALGFFATGLISRFARNAPQSTPEKQWLSRCLLSMSLFLSCILFALVLHFAGAHVGLVGVLFAVGALSLLFWRPGAPADPSATLRP